MFTPHRQSAKKAATATIWLALFAIPLYAGAAVFLNPLHPDAGNPWNQVVPLSSIPDDGIPRRFAVFVPNTDAWARLPDRLTGYVYLRRLPLTDTVTALAATHSESWIPVEFNANLGVFDSCCWEDRFDISGQHLADDPRVEDMQALETKVANGVVFVAAQQ